MKQKLIYLTGALLLAFMFCSCSNDDTPFEIYGTIAGQVTDYDTGNPLINAQVTLIPGAKTTQTGTDGAFSFSGLDEGQYTVSVQKNGYQSNRKNVTVVSGETVSIVVTLESIPNNN